MIQKVSPIYFEGHKIIRISDLPATQHHLFAGWIQPSALIPFADSKVPDCAPYEDYEFWFINYYLGEKDLNYLI